MDRAIVLAFGLACLAAPLRAETIVIRPDPCPAAAEQPLIIDLGDVETFNAGPQSTLGPVFVIYPPMGEGWASARLLMRFDLDAPDARPVETGCGARKIFRMPR